MHMTYVAGDLRRRVDAADLELPATDAVRFIPMNLRLAYPTIVETYERLAFHLSPAPAAIDASQETLDSDSTAFRDDLDILDFPEHFEIHAAPRRVEYQSEPSATMSSDSYGLAGADVEVSGARTT